MHFVSYLYFTDRINARNMGHFQRILRSLAHRLLTVTCRESEFCRKKWSIFFCVSDAMVPHTLMFSERMSDLVHFYCFFTTWFILIYYAVKCEIHGTVNEIHFLTVVSVQIALIFWDVSLPTIQRASYKNIFFVKFYLLWWN
jgi:hypothetical protein